jgi:hypothetical protein
MDGNFLCRLAYPNMDIFVQACLPNNMANFVQACFP